MFRKLTPIVAMLAGGCAAQPETIGAAYVSETPYQSWNCPQLATEKQRIGDAYMTAARAQVAAANTDQDAVVLIGLPVASMNGKDRAGEIARLKGEHEAIKRTMTTKGCPI